MTRYALRVDANQDQIISALKAAGATVKVIGKPLDLLVGCGTSKQRLMLVECKVPGGKHTAAQVRFMKEWEGYPISTVDGPEAALRALNVLRAS
ncbi:MAG: hypothetical protein KGL39_23755 [Patescibacteria group bacterium]|nr:hypothetical protein [Patescibacteria group bacterium]